MKKLNLKQVMLYLAIGFLIYLIWRNPNGASETVGNYLGKAGNLVTEIVRKVGDFLGGLAGHDKGTTPTTNALAAFVTVH